MSPTFSQNKRTDVRIPVRIIIRFRLLKSPVGEEPEPNLHNGNNLISNLSRSGFFLSTKNFLEVGSIIELEFGLETFQETVKAEAEVIRTNNYNFPNHGRYEYGLRFTSLHPHFRQILDQFVKLREG